MKAFSTLLLLYASASTFAPMEDSNYGDSDKAAIKTHRLR